ncbi:hypothetical protein [Nocardioides aestuarii]|uniref:DUF4064 domain-containing protein n=1 Tax=Nocardioides aestuarii TaxID=252231 RepID=A0ABW4TLF2_9ACTN
MSETRPRPGHTTLAGALVVGGAVGVVVSVAEQLSGLYSLETREQVTQFLETPPGSDFGLSVTAALDGLRVVLMVLAGLATAAGVLGFHALRGSTGARLGLSVLAFPIFVLGIAVGGVLTALVAAGTALMWSGPSAFWFRGEPVPERPRREGPAGQAGAPPLPVRRPGATRPQDPAGATLTAERPTAPPAGPAVPGPPPVRRRPDALVWACVLTWAFSGLAAVMMGASALLMATSPDLVVEELQRQGNELGDTGADAITEAVYLSAAVIIGWSLLASVFAVLAFRGVPAGRSGLLASALVAAFVSLLGVLATAVVVVPAVAALATVVLLNRAEVRAWCSGPRGKIEP